MNTDRRAAHSARPPGRATRRALAGAGLCAGIAAVGIGTTALVGVPSVTTQPTQDAPTTVQHITVSSTNARIPLTDEQILRLLDQRPDFGPLGDPSRRAACLSGLGYPVSTPILGALPIEIIGHRGVLLVLPGDQPERLAIVAVPATCSAADTGLLATTALARR